MKFVLIILLGVSIPFCKNANSDKPLAKVGDKILYSSELHNIIKPGMNTKDSIAIARSYRDKWIAKQLLLHHAELNLSKDQKDVSHRMEEYKNSLLIYIYQQSLVGEKVDTMVTPAEIQNYYKEHVQNFLLSKDIVKALYIKVPANAEGLDKLKAWYRSSKTEDVQAIDNYCFHHAAEYSYFNDDWLFFEDLLKKLPVKVEDKSAFLKNTSSIETRDSLFQYFVHIKEYKLRRDTAPIFMIEHDVKNIILNKRKMNFLNELEENIYKEALKNNEFTIY